MTLRRSASPPLRFIALLLCLSSLFGQLGAVAHQALEDHVVCAEHGELIHADDGHASTSASEKTARKLGTSEDAHEHCGVLGHRHDECVAPSSLIEASYPGTPSASVSLRVVPTIAFARVRLLALAPKQSPPPTNG